MDFFCLFFDGRKRPKIKTKSVEDLVPKKKNSFMTSLIR